MSEEQSDPHLEAVGRRLSQQLPSMLRDLHAKKMGTIVAGNGHVPTKRPCTICGNNHYGGAFKERNKHCPKCRRALREGATAFTTLTPGSWRYLIVKDDRIKDEHRGVVVVVSDEAMDKLEKTYKPASAEE